MSQPTHAVRVRATPDQARERLRTALAGARGGDNRRRIVRALAERPRNANRLAGDLSLDYKTVRHHLSVLKEADAVTKGGDRYGAVYLLTPRLRQHWDVVEATGDGDGAEG
ncbi:ArsR family transcriptional regulator [Salinigranum rubrum]|uniref:ArsR family transcriptional regulator n=1 Tax=Salinigranum rubrum TaxID=755307 RepID=A0A2I8VIX5_9EURY|nr:winged helix-turn-helix domain-containing protein [Salinigranum rubrum]AUV81844.1 ArsR family transcriptional regulator [Salinigranum rubrum]